MKLSIRMLVTPILVVWSLGLLVFVLNSQHYPSIPPKETEAIVVLTGGSHRIKEGLSLLDNINCKKIFISGVNKSISPARLMRKIKGQRLPEKCTLELGYKAENTQQNAQEVKDWLDSNKFRSFVLVTSDYHMARSLLELNAVLRDTSIEPYPVQASVFDDKKKHAVFKHALFMFQEYHKYIAVWFRVNVWDALRS